MKHDAYLNRISLAVPEHDIHQKFIDYAPSLLPDARSRALFSRMAERCHIDHRYSCLKPHPEVGRLDADGFYGDTFPDTEKRMQFYRRHAFALAKKAIDGLNITELRDEITHLIITTCTGFYAPGLDVEVISHYGLKPNVERTMIGFMGCHAGISALKLARHIVRSSRNARVLILNLEICTIHLQKTENLEQMLSFLLFADGAAAGLVSADPEGIELQSFHSVVIPESREHITWSIGGNGFDMKLSGQVPHTIATGLPERLKDILDGRTSDDFHHWAVHPGGRTILDAVLEGARLTEDVLIPSREVLREFGNMSSATIMFVLKKIMKDNHGKNSPGRGCGLAFGPGLTVESMLFQHAA